MGFALGVVPVVLLLLGFPIYIVLLTAVSVALVFFMHVPFAALHQNLFGAIDAFALLAVPFFIYAGELMSRGSVAQRIVDFVQAGVGRIPGSLGVTTVGSLTDWIGKRINVQKGWTSNGITTVPIGGMQPARAAVKTGQLDGFP